MAPRKVVTAANCFAHIEDVHAIVEGILDLLAPDGVFISESHYLIGLLDTLAIRHDLSRAPALLLGRQPRAISCEMHGLEVFHARPIPTHGGSIRVYAARTRRAAGAATASARCSRPSRAATRCARA